MKRDIIEFIMKAYEFAEKKHKGQFRTNGAEYIEHPVRVARLIEKYKLSNHQDWLIAAALLHDTLEDTYTSYRELSDEFGEVVASLVVELTTAKYVPKIVGKEVYLAQKMQFMSDYALDIKLADRFDNICDMHGVPQEKREKTFAETRFISRYLKEHRELSNTQKIFLKFIDDVVDNNKRYDVCWLCDEHEPI